MGTLNHFKDLYVHAFENCRPTYVVYILEAYSLFCAVMLSMALYAFLFRVFTGFEF